MKNFEFVKNGDFLMNYYFDEWPTTRRKHPR